MRVAFLFVHRFSGTSQEGSTSALLRGGGLYYLIYHPAFGTPPKNQ